MITLALSKGRIFEETMPLLAAAGIEVTEDPEKSRKLILATTRSDVRVVLVRASDVPTYVQYGGADLGVTGLDTLLEHNMEQAAGARLQPVKLGADTFYREIGMLERADNPRAHLNGGFWRALAAEGDIPAYE